MKDSKRIGFLANITLVMRLDVVLVQRALAYSGDKILPKCRNCHEPGGGETLDPSY